MRSDLEVDYLDLTEKTMVSIPGTEMKVEVGAITSFKYKVRARLFAPLGVVWGGSAEGCRSAQR